MHDSGPTSIFPPQIVHCARRSRRSTGQAEALFGAGVSEFSVVSLLLDFPGKVEPEQHTGALFIAVTLFALVVVAPAVTVLCWTFTIARARSRGRGPRVRAARWPCPALPAACRTVRDVLIPRLRLPLGKPSK